MSATEHMVVEAVVLPVDKAAVSGRFFASAISGGTKSFFFSSFLTGGLVIVLASPVLGTAAGSLAVFGLAIGPAAF